MKIFIWVTLFFLVSFSLCIADDASFKKAYSLYYQGKPNQAINVLEAYVNEYPDPKALYFLGYVYYESKKMVPAMKYFKEAYLIDPDYSPMIKKYMEEKK